MKCQSLFSGKKSEKQPQFAICYGQEKISISSHNLNINENNISILLHNLTVENSSFGCTNYECKKEQKNPIIF